MNHPRLVLNVHWSRSLISCSWQWMAFLWVSCAACSVAPPAPAALPPSSPSCPLNPPMPSCPTWRPGLYRPDPQGRRAFVPGEELGVLLEEGMPQGRGAGSSTSQSGRNSSIPNGNWISLKCSWLAQVGGTELDACTSAVPLRRGKRGKQLVPLGNLKKIRVLCWTRYVSRFIWTPVCLFSSHRSFTFRNSFFHLSFVPFPASFSQFVCYLYPEGRSSWTHSYFIIRLFVFMAATCSFVASFPPYWWFYRTTTFFSGFIGCMGHCRSLITIDVFTLRMKVNVALSVVLRHYDVQSAIFYHLII